VHSKTPLCGAAYTTFAVDSLAIKSYHSTSDNHNTGALPSLRRVKQQWTSPTGQAWCQETHRTTLFWELC
jgi:hypothetical protein